tara:strand:+ start:533 stop:655 length:123 start_codon:yes stop_codon:yes gene_type:complete
MKQFAALLVLSIILLVASGCMEQKFPHGQQVPPPGKESKH